MTEAHAPHADDEHATDDVHGHDDHGRGAAALGPIDIMSWGMAALGVVLGLVVVVALLRAAS